ncbi:MAG: hypothetical protein QFB89_02790 [Pseudomonadota bacterium]|nr:hypothetical protein [Pseudomonadota bacterium]
MRSVIRAAAGLLLVAGLSSPAIGQNPSPADDFYQALQLDRLVVEATASAKRVSDKRMAALPASQKSSIDNSAAAVDSAKTEFKTRIIQLMNSSFSPKQLSEVNAFLQSDAGKAFEAFTPKLSQALPVELMRASLDVARANGPKK